MDERSKGRPGPSPAPLDPNRCPVSSGAAGFDPFSAEWQADPAAYVALAREHEPVFYAPVLGYWVVTRYEDVKAVFRDFDTYSSAVTLEKISPSIPDVQGVLDRYHYAMERTLVNEDEPTHMLRRRVLMEPFTAARLGVLEKKVRLLTRQAVDAFVNNGQADLVSQMLYTVPLTVAMHFLGIPEDDMAKLKEFSVAHTVNTWGRPTPDEQLKVAEGVGRFWQYAGEILDRIRQDPSGDGWMHFSVRQQSEYPEIVTDSYLHSMMMAGIVAAHETTAYAAANAVKHLLENRSLWEEICEIPALIPNTVEESLRYVSSIVAWRRVTTQPTTLGGVPLPAGAKLLLVQAAANRDPRQFEDGDAFDVRRTSASDHLSFGYGAHQCMGKNLARMELQIFLQELTIRLPHLELIDQEFEYVPNTSFRGPQALKVQWDPQANPERNTPPILRQTFPVVVGEPSAAALSRSVVVEDTSRLSDDVLQLTLREVRGKPLPHWASGAHIDVDCGADENGELRSRQYSLCGPVGASTYTIAILHQADGRGGSRWVHENALRGGTVTIRGPRNHFRLRADARRVVLIAGGIGITPILAHADAARALGIEYEIHYAGRTESSMAYLDRLAKDHAARYRIYTSDKGIRLNLGELLGEVPDGTRVYCCGPARMSEELEELSANWPEGVLHLEHFASTLGQLDPEQEHAFDLVLMDSGMTLRVDRDQTVLQAMRAANIDVQSDCCEGICGSCEVPVVEGEVDHRDVVLTRAERQSGKRMMVCCSRASGDRLVLDL